MRVCFAPGLFGSSCGRRFASYATTPMPQQRYSGHGEATVWRLLVPKSRHHVYYERDERANVATVLLVDNVVSAEGPDL